MIKHSIKIKNKKWNKKPQKENKFQKTSSKEREIKKNSRLGEWVGGSKKKWSEKWRAKHGEKSYYKMWKRESKKTEVVEKEEEKERERARKRERES